MNAPLRGPSIAFDNVGLQLSGSEILRGVTFSVAPGTIHCIVGPNGGGKTSLVRCLLGQMPHTGTIAMTWGSGGRTIGYVPQFLDFDKTLPLTVTDLMALLCQRRPAFVGLGRRHRAGIEAALDRVGLNGKRRSRLGSLSGGERQRVLVAQALVPEPSLLVLDEPMTSMDEIGAARFETIIRELSAAGVTIVWIAHDLAQVRAMAGAVTGVNRSLLFSGPPADVLAERQTDVLFGQARSVT